MKGSAAGEQAVGPVLRGGEPPSWWSVLGAAVQGAREASGRI